MARDPLVGWNCIFASKNYGFYVARAVQCGYGFQIMVATSEGRDTRTAYTSKRIPGGFSITTQHSRYSEFRKFTEWMRNYGMRWKARSNHNHVGVMQVLIPSINFNQYGIPSSMIPLGDEPTVVTWQIPMEFESVDVRHNALVDRARMTLPDAKHLASPGMSEVPSFYPDGVQAQGQETFIDAIYDSGLTPEQINAINPPPPPPKKPGKVKFF